jgi:uncharacterized damage-inducible protein DinB
MQSENLIQSLLEQTRQIINQAEKLKQDDLQTLIWRDNETSWNILECLEHLNLYSDFYLPEIENKMKNTTTAADPEFKSGVLGKYFANSMLPKEKTNKMKTFKNKNPLNAHLDRMVIDKFINQQIALLHLLNQSRNVSLNKVKIRTSFSGLVKMNLGDTFQFFINHIVRHFTQIERIKHSMQSAYQPT